MRANELEKQRNLRVKVSIFALFLCLLTNQIVFGKSQKLLTSTTAISNTKVADAAEAAGRLVGTATAELVIGKGAAVAFKGLLFLGKTESGMRLLQEIGGAAQKAKEAIGSIPIPVKAAEIVLTDGSKIKIPFGETKRLDELLKPLESRAKQVLSSGAEKVKAINLPSWDKLTLDIDHVLSGHKTDGTRLAQSIRAGGRKTVFPETMTDKQIVSAIKTAYGNAKKVETQIDFGTGAKKVALVGEANGMKIKMYVDLDNKVLETAFPLSH